MTVSASLTLLPRADGSATFTAGRTTVIASVSGPMEVKPRDELPDRAFIEIIVRPAVGVGGTRERLLESCLLAALSPLILQSHHPRTLLQINIQLVEASDHTDTTALLPACINAAVLALIDAGSPLGGVLVATSLFFDAKGSLVEREDAEKVKVWRKGGSRHILGFVERRGKRECVFADSQGEFDEAIYRRAVQVGQQECAVKQGEDVVMEDKLEETVGIVVRRAIEKKVEADMRWRRD